MYREVIIDKLRKNKELLLKQYHIEKIGLFGSYARNSHTPKSDIDLVIELVEGKRLGFKEWYDLEENLKKMLNAERVDIVNRQYINPLVEHEMAKSVIYV